MSTIADRLLNLYNKMVIANSVTNEFVTALPDCYDAVEAKGGTLPAQQTAANLPQAIESIPEALPLGFTPSASSPELTSVLSVMVDARTIVEIDDPTITYIYKEDVFRNCSNLVKVSLPNLTSLQGYSTFCGCTNLEELNLPNLETMANLPTASWNGNSWRFLGTKLKEVILPKVTNIVGDRIFETASGVCQLEKISVPELTTWQGARWWYSSADDLIDVELGKNFTSNFGYLSKWTATNAIKSDSTSLVKDGETFASNLEKLLYNIRNHIAANLRSDVGNKTITFHANVYNAIQADSATVAAFPANWTIASA